MSIINDEIVTGVKFRTMIDKISKKWQLSSFWTKASDVEFNDGENAETKVGAIKGITTDTNTNVEGYAADMTVVSQLNSDIDRLGGFTPIIDSTGKITGYKTEAGADTVFPFNRGNFLEDTPLGGSYIGSSYDLGSIGNGYSLAGKIPYYDKIRTSDFRVVYNNVRSRAGCSSNVDGYGDSINASGNPVNISYNSSNGIISLSIKTSSNIPPTSSPGTGKSENCYSDKWTSNRANISSAIYVGSGDYRILLSLPPNYAER